MQLNGPLPGEGGPGRLRQQRNVLVAEDIDYVAKWLASQYHLAKKEEKAGYVDALVVALEGASQPTRDAIVQMLGITYKYPGGRQLPDNRSAA